MKKNVLKNILMLVGLLVFVMLMSGCAPAPIDLSYHGGVSINSIKSNKNQKLHVLPVRDLRNASPDYITTIKTVSYTQYGGEIPVFISFKAQQQLADVVTDALKQNLNNIYVLTDDGQAAILSTNILELNYAYDNGFFTQITSADILLQFKLMDAKHNKILWAKTLRGKAKVQHHNGIKGTSVKELFDKVLDDVVSQLIQEEDFKQAIQ